MTRGALIPALVTKEVRALGPAWLACLAAIVASAVGAGPFRGLGIGVCFLGTAALGALSVGHEYSHRTLAALLSQPARRERLLLVKLAVVVPMLLTLWAVASAVLFNRSGSLSDLRPAHLSLPFLCGLFVAPWLTMICRSAIAGTVFAVGIPGAVVVLGDLGVNATYGFGPETDAFRAAIRWGGTLGLCAVGAVMSWRTFMRLEAIDGPSPGPGLPQWLRWPATAGAAAPVLTKRHAIWMLAKKELRLQYMALVVAGFYVLGWLTAVSLNPLVPHAIDIFTVLSVFNGLLISLLIGSLASAEERQFGTLEWQVLLPVASSKQWAVKVGLVLSLALLLAFGLPALLTSISPGQERFRSLQLGFGVIALATASLYVSSTCASGLWAMLMSLPAAIGVVLFVTSLRYWMSVMLGRGFNIALIRFDSALEPLLAAAFLALLLRFALVNHRSAERAARRIWIQGLWIAGALTAATIVAGSVAP